MSEFWLGVLEGGALGALFSIFGIIRGWRLCKTLLLMLGMFAGTALLVAAAVAVTV